jgi:hypothetical protein
MLQPVDSYVCNYRLPSNDPRMEYGFLDPRSVYCRLRPRALKPSPIG